MNEGKSRKRTHQGAAEALSQHVENKVHYTSVQEHRSEKSERLIWSVIAVRDVETAKAANVGHSAYGEEKSE